MRRPKHLRRKAADRRQHGIGGDDPVMLRRHQCNPRIDEGLLRIEHVERRALTHAGFFPHAIERNFRRVTCALGRMICALAASS